MANSNSGTGPSIVITGVANFGSPENANTISPLETMTQFQDNLSWQVGDHGIKFGGGLNRINDTRRSNVFARYTFSSIPNYVSANTGILQAGASCPSGPTRCYTNYLEAFGDPNIKYQSTFYNFFAQDDWRVTRKLKLNYGLRYDLYDIPTANASSPYFASQKFKVDKNNFAPRLGLVYGLRDGKLPTVIRASAGIYYDTVYLDFYLRALQNNGSPTYFNFSFLRQRLVRPHSLVLWEAFRRERHFLYRVLRRSRRTFRICMRFTRTFRSSRRSRPTFRSLPDLSILVGVTFHFIGASTE